MDDKLFDIFSEETDVPECVCRRVDETLEMIENSAWSDKAYRQEERTKTGSRRRNKKRIIGLYSFKVLSSLDMLNLWMIKKKLKRSFAD